MEIAGQQVVLPDGAGGLRIGPATLEIERGRIRSVRDGCAAEADQVGGLLCPAFVNAHTHLSMSAFRGIGGLAAMRGNVVEDLYYRLETGLTADEVGAFTRLGIAESLLAGVGTVWDHYYFAGAVADAARDCGITAVVAPTLQDLGGPGRDQLEDQLQATVDLASSRSHREAGVVAALGPHATDTVSADLFDRIAELAERHRLPLHLHAAQSAEEFRRARERHGISPVRWLTANGWLEAGPSSLLVHVLYADREELAALDAERIVLGYCPGSQIQYCFPAWTEGWRSLDRRIAIATDAGACNDSMNVQQELRLAAGGPLFGVPRDEAFGAFWEGRDEAAERVASRREDLLRASAWQPADLLASVWEIPGSLHPDLPVGAIRAGHLANLLVFDTDHPNFWPGTDLLRALALQDVTPAIERMMVNGRWLSEPGQHQRTVLGSAWLQEARERARGGLERLADRVTQRNP